MRKEVEYDHESELYNRLYGKLKTQLLPKEHIELDKKALGVVWMYWSQFD